jgi:hypothetical protein
LYKLSRNGAEVNQSVNAAFDLEFRFRRHAWKEIGIFDGPELQTSQAKPCAP